MPEPDFLTSIVLAFLSLSFTFGEPVELLMLEYSLDCFTPLVLFDDAGMLEYSLDFFTDETGFAFLEVRSPVAIDCTGRWEVYLLAWKSE